MQVELLTPSLWWVCSLWLWFRVPLEWEVLHPEEPGKQQQ